MAAVLPGRPAADDHEAQRHDGEATDLLCVPVTGAGAWPLQSDRSCPGVSCPGRRMPSPTASIGAASSPDRRWSGARWSPPPPTSCCAPPRPTPRCAAAGQSCACGSLCCDGYTEFCCAIYGANACPSGSLTGGWWKADGSSFCGGAARYYMDCHKPCGAAAAAAAASAAARATARRAVAATAAATTARRDAPRSATATATTARACIGPIQCRVVTCTAAVADRAVCSSQRGAHRQQHPLAQPSVPPGRAADLPGRRRLGRRPASTASASTTTATAGGRSGRRATTSNPVPKFTYGRHRRRPSRSSATGTATARDSIGIFRERTVAPQQHGQSRATTVLHQPEARASGRRHPGGRRLERRRDRRPRDLPQAATGT